jgi:chromosomal replication initiator protein
MVGPQRYKVWFKNSTELTMTDEFLKVGVPNVFIGDWIENHFSETISSAASEVTGRQYHVAYTVDPSIMPQIRKRQLDSQAEYIQNNADRAARHQRKTGNRPPTKPLRGTFDAFVQGQTNQIAFTAAKSVAEQPAQQFNPLFIHGGCGLGKTHLLQAICNAYKEQKPDLRWVCASGEEFTNRFVYAVKSGSRDAFRKEFRSVDVLIIDDIHFLANKKATQEEFLHTFNDIHSIGKQVVMASDAHPKMIGQLSESLVNRFVSGMVVKIEAPDFVTRCEILRRHAVKLSKQIPEPVIEYIAENIKGNVRELEGSLVKLVAFASVAHQPLTISVAKHTLHDYMQRTAPILQTSDIESITATYFGLTPADLHTSRKTRTIALSRGIVMFLARKHTDMSFPEIGRFLGNKNHSTVILACRRLNKILKEEGDVRWNTPIGEKRQPLSDIIQVLEEQLGTGPEPGPAEEAAA